MVYGETVTKLYKTFPAIYPPVGSMTRMVLVDEDYGSIGEAQHMLLRECILVVSMNLEFPS
jgi:hypothetical protein